MHTHPWPDDWIVPEALPPGARAVMTTRGGGISSGPYETMNLGIRVGDESQAVQANRATLERWMGVEPIYLHQVHGTRVLRLDAHSPAHLSAGQEPEADASCTTERSHACAVQTADCLPVLFVARDAAGRACGVAAAHAGWRGLAAGVLDATVQALTESARVMPDRLWAWIGPGIGPDHFEVGADVLRAFDAQPDAPGAAFRPGRAGHWLADLPALARERLARLGVRDVHGGRWCTVSDSRFFSFRRDRVTGRMAACIWLVGD